MTISPLNGYMYRYQILPVSKQKKETIVGIMGLHIIHCSF